ncbi:hypothetical protein F5884DRAFT_805575 [Xylogone sp. PMI_703]|nr:hypothetical protein F5884DRAFT_805575 [Xylogone sp. PMI_703]
MVSLASILVQRAFLRALYTGNMLWHTSAFFHFTFRPKYIMRKLSHRRSSTTPFIASTPEGDRWHHDILAYLGGMNTGYIVLAAFRLYALSKLPTGSNSGEENMDVIALTVLAIANASQAVLNFGLGLNTRRWIMGTGFDRITVLDPTFAVLDSAVVVTRLLGF